MASKIYKFYVFADLPQFESHSSATPPQMRRFRTWNSQLNAFGVVQNAPNQAPGQTISEYCHFVVHNVRNMVRKHNVSY